MRFLFASILLFFFISCSESIKKEDLKMLYPDKEKPIKFQQDWQFEFYYNRIEEFKINPIGFNKIVFLGNSITEAGADWNKRFNVQNIVNRGISGDITEGVLNRIGEIIYYKPLAVFLLIGINDIFNSDLPDRDKITAEYVSNNILNISNRIIEGSPSTKIFIQTTLPINNEIYIKEKGWFPSHSTPLTTQINDINKLLIKKCKNTPFKIIDLHSVFTNERGLLNENYTTDGVHLNENGYTAWVDFIDDVILSLK